ISGLSVELTESPIAGIRWSRLRDKSICIIDQSRKVIIPYSVFLRIASSKDTSFADIPIVCFIKCVKELIEKVDKQVYDVEPWKLWEKFGAYFHALRINALLIIGVSKAKISEIFPDTLINCRLDDELLLKPTAVLHSSDALDVCSTPEIGVFGHPSEKHNWLDENIVVVNASGGKGVDIFFALKTTYGRTVVFLDQRKRVASTALSIGRINSLLNSTRLKLPFLPRDSLVIACLFNCLVSASVWSTSLPLNSIVVTKRNLEAYHGSLYTHPAAAPFVDINHDPVTYIKMVLDGSTNE
ncbi:hypothetical protein MP638_000215, partial [Amoeboaphelidium occidentale]